MTVPTDGFARKVLGDAEALGQLPQLGAAIGQGGLIGAAGDERADGPLVRVVFVFWRRSRGDWQL